MYLCIYVFMYLCIHVSMYLSPCLTVDARNVNVTLYWGIFSCNNLSSLVGVGASSGSPVSPRDPATWMVRNGSPLFHSEFPGNSTSTPATPNSSRPSSPGSNASVVLAAKTATTTSGNNNNNTVSPSTGAAALDSNANTTTYSGISIGGGVAPAAELHGDVDDDIYTGSPPRSTVTYHDVDHALDDISTHAASMELQGREDVAAVAVDNDSAAGNKQQSLNDSVAAGSVGAKRSMQSKVDFVTDALLQQMVGGVLSMKKSTINEMS
jgi:hypothetical protein